MTETLEILQNNMIEVFAVMIAAAVANMLRVLQKQATAWLVEKTDQETAKKFHQAFLSLERQAFIMLRARMVTEQEEGVNFEKPTAWRKLASEVAHELVARQMPETAAMVAGGQDVATVRESLKDSLVLSAQNLSQVLRQGRGVLEGVSGPGEYDARASLDMAPKFTGR